MSLAERGGLIQLRSEVAEYEVEFRGLKNQDITIRKLESEYLLFMLFKLIVDHVIMCSFIYLSTISYFIPFIFQARLRSWKRTKRRKSRRS